MNGTYVADSTTTGSGNVTLDGQTISMTGVEPIGVFGVNSFVVTTPNPDDTLSITSVFTSLTRLSGTSGAVTLSPVTFSEISTFVIDADANDGGAGDDSLTVAATGSVPTGVGFIHYETGTGANTLDVQTGTARIDSTVATGATLDTTVGTGPEDTTATLVTHRFRQTSLDIQSQGHAIILPDGTMPPHPF